MMFERSSNSPQRVTLNCRTPPADDWDLDLNSSAIDSRRTGTPPRPLVRAASLIMTGAGLVQALTCPLSCSAVKTSLPLYPVGARPHFPDGAHARVHHRAMVAQRRQGRVARRGSNKRICVATRFVSQKTDVNVGHAAMQTVHSVASRRVVCVRTSSARGWMSVVVMRLAET